MASELLVTGGTGLVGSALRTLRPEGITLSRKDGDLTDFCRVREIFRKYKPRFVMHLAAKVAGVKTNAEKNADMFMENVQINTNVLRAAQESGVEKLVTVLSNCVFQDPPVHPPKESEVHIGMPYAGHRGYGYAKRMLDMQIQLLRAQYGCRFTSITPVTIIGPNDNWDPNESHVAGSLIHKCALAKKNGTPLEVWGSGRAVRQFVYSGDIARILLKVLESYDDPETLIVAPGEGASVKTLAETIARVMDFRGEIRFDASKPEGELKRVLDNSKFNRTFPDFKFTPIEEALRAAAQSYLESAEGRKPAKKG